MINATNFKSARIAAGLTQSQLARVTGIAGATIACYEQGVRTPSGKNLEILAAALGIRPEVLQVESPARQIAEENLRAAEARVNNLRGIDAERAKELDAEAESLIKEIDDAKV